MKNTVKENAAQDRKGGKWIFNATIYGVDVDSSLYLATRIRLQAYISIISFQRRLRSIAVDMSDNELPLAQSNCSSSLPPCRRRGREGGGGRGIARFKVLSHRGSGAVRHRTAPRGSVPYRAARRIRRVKGHM